MTICENNMGINLRLTTYGGSDLKFDASKLEKENIQVAKI